MVRNQQAPQENLLGRAPQSRAQIPGGHRKVNSLHKVRIRGLRTPVRTSRITQVVTLSLDMRSTAGMTGTTMARITLGTMRVVETAAEAQQSDPRVCTGQT